MTVDTSTFFDDDDEETQRYLLAEGSDDGSLPSRLESLSKRFKEDHDFPALDNHWKCWMDAVKSDGFCLSESSKAVASTTANNSASLPESFDSEDGKKHLQATQSLLGLKSEQRAAQLTVSALREMKDAKNLQSLLGTRRLVEIVMDYHYRQRSARISTIAELLRQEQGEGGALADCSSKILGELDSSFTMDGKDRGLFKCLASIACRGLDGQEPSRDQLAKAKELSSGTPTTLRDSMNQSSGENSWHQFAGRCLSSIRNCTHQERKRAMEALVALLYNRIQGGVSRADYMILLNAFQSAGGFFTTSVDGEELSHLAGLVCAECTGLWRILFDDNQGEAECVANLTNHPLLIGVLPSPGTPNDASQAEAELKALKKYLLQLHEENQDLLDPNQMESRRSAPESLAFLSFGLLLMMSYDTILPSPHGSNPNGCWQVFREEGQELVMKASAEMAVFDVFHSMMSSLVRSPPSRFSGRHRADLPYDWLLFGRTQATLIEIDDGTNDDVGLEMDGASMINASIGQEIVLSLIIAFGDSILAPQHESMRENLSMICDLAASIYRSSPGLCSRFWIDWEQFTSPSPPPGHFPLCRIVDLAFFSMNQAVNSGRAMEKEEVLAALAPLMQLLASFCCSADKVEAAVDVLNPTMLQHALVFCAADGDAHSNEQFSQNRLRFLKSLSAMTSLGDSTTCRKGIREALSMSGPSLLFKTVASSDARCSELALDILADLLKDAPVEWTRSFVREMQPLVGQIFFERSEALLPLARIFSALALSMPLFVFSELISDAEADRFLDLIWRGVQRLSPALPLCLSCVTRESVPLKTVTSILNFFSSLLENLGAVVSSSQPVSTQALQLRSALVELMSSHLGESVMFYAVMPLSICVAHNIESYAEERNILKSASMQENNQKDKYGMWLSTVTAPSRSSETNAQLKDLISSMNVENISEYAGFDFSEICTVVSKALGLLRLWAGNVLSVATSEVKTHEQPTGLTSEERERLASLSPHKLLAMTAALPSPMRRKAGVKDLYQSVSPSNFELLTKYLEGGDVWPFDVSAVCLDILHACISHTKMSSMQETLKGVVERSKLFQLMASLAARSAETAGSSEEYRETSILSILAFRVASVTLEALPTVGNFGSSGEKLMKAAFSGIERACNNLYRFREANNKLGLNSDPLLGELLYGTACLGFLGSVWEDANRLEGVLELTQAYDNESAAFTALTKVLLQHAHSQSQIEPAVRGCVCSFLAAALRFLRVATEVALRTEKTATCSMMGMMKENSLPLMSMPQYFLGVDAVAVATHSNDLAVYTSSISKKMNMSAPYLLLKQFPTLAARDTVGLFNVDVSALMVSLPVAVSDAKVAIFSMAVSHYNLSSQVRLIGQWREFADVLLRLSTSQHSSSAGFGDSALVGHNETPSHKYLLACLEVLRMIRDNSNNIESATVAGASLKIQDVSQISLSTTGLVLVLISASGICDGKRANAEVLTEIFRLLSPCATKLFNILETNPEVCCRVEQNIFTAVIGVLLSLSPSKLEESVVDQLVQVVYRLLQLLEVKSLRRDDCLKTCVTLLTIMLTATEGADLVGGKVIDALVRQADAYFKPMQQSAKATNAVALGEEKRIEVLESIVNFLHASLSSSREMIELVYNSGAFQLLTKNLIFERASHLWGSPDATTASLRGYIPSQERIQSRTATKTTAFFSGSDDPNHRLWLGVLRTFRTLCRSSRRFFLPSPAKKERFQGLVADFIFTHHKIMLSCCSGVNEAAFTRHSIAEATLILSLLSEFCSRPCRDGKTLELISNVFIPVSIQMIARLGTFLGASSASRELFDSMGDADAEDDSNVDMTARLSPFNRVHNARHEAIRYSHNAARAYFAVTPTEGDSSNFRSDPDLRSASALEKHGKAQMNSDFARTMELSAAECLLSAVSLLWETHPVNGSFVMLDRRIDSNSSLQLVKQGMVIGFCSDRESQRGYIHFAQVMEVDTIKRAWKVRCLETGETEIVKSNQVMGIEDTSRRLCVLRFAAAPDSSTELEDDASSVSVGHLILALRWCSVICNPPPAVMRLAVLVSSLLGAELSMHKLIGSSMSSKPEVLERLYAQLLDLYRDVGGPDGVSHGTRGRLKVILDEKSWATIRQQVKEELDHAEQAGEKDHDSEDMIWSSRSAANPFQDLRMTY